MANPFKSGRSGPYGYTLGAAAPAAPGAGNGSGGQGPRSPPLSPAASNNNSNNNNNGNGAAGAGAPGAGMPPAGAQDNELLNTFANKILITKEVLTPDEWKIFDEVVRRQEMPVLPLNATGAVTDPRIGEAELKGMKFLHELKQTDELRKAILDRIFVDVINGLDNTPLSTLNDFNKALSTRREIPYSESALTPYFLDLLRMRSALLKYIQDYNHPFRMTILPYLDIMILKIRKERVGKYKRLLQKGDNSLLNLWAGGLQPDGTQVVYPGLVEVNGELADINVLGYQLTLDALTFLEKEYLENKNNPAYAEVLGDVKTLLDETRIAEVPYLQEVTALLGNYTATAILHRLNVYNANPARGGKRLKKTRKGKGKKRSKKTRKH